MAGLSGASSARLPDVIREKLAVFAARRARVHWLRALAETLIGFALLAFGVSLWLWWLEPGLEGRTGFSAALYLGTLAVFWWRGLRPARGHPPLVEVAGQFEQAAAGRLQERLLSSVELASHPPPGVSAWMTQRTIDLAAKELRPIAPEQLVDARPFQRAARSALLALVLLLGLAWGLTPYWRLAINPFTTPLAAGAARLLVAPGSCRLKLGDSLQIEAAAQPVPVSATLLVRWQDGFEERLPMTTAEEAGRFTQRLGPLSQGCRYQVQAGENTSPAFTVTLEGPPRLEGLRLTLTPPAYTGWPAQVVDAGDGDLLEGGRARLEARLGGGPAKAVDLLPTGEPDQAMVLSTNLATLELSPKTDLQYGLRLTGADGLVAQPSDRWTLRVQPDLPPTAALEAPGNTARWVGRDELLLLQVSAQDDVGLKHIELIHLVNGTNTFRQRLRWEPKPGERGRGQAAALETACDLAQRPLELGDELELRVEATDTRGQTGRSDSLQLSVVKPGDAEAARLAARLREELRRTDLASAWLRQLRLQWLAWARNFGSDPAQATAQGRWLRQGLVQLRVDLAQVGTNLFALAGQTKLPIAPYLAGLAGELAAWGDAQSRMLDRATEAVLQAAPAQRSAAAARGRDLLAHAQQEMTTLRAHVALAPVALETEVMVARSEMAQASCQHALPPLRAALRWDANQQIGLLADFFAGKDLAGPIALRKVDRPSFDNFEVPKVGPANWSARYTGELNIPETGRWNLVCLANDGVRLMVDGRSVFPPGAWAAQGPKEHKATLELAAGWHPVTLEFFQAGGPNQLHFRVGREGGALPEVPVEQLRTRLPTVAAAVTHIAGLTAEAVQAATNRLVRGFLRLSEVSPGLVAITNDVPHPDLMRLAEAKAAVGPSLQTNLSRFRDWATLDASLAEAQGNDLLGAAREARRLVLDQLNARRHRWWGAPELQALRQPVDQLRATAQEMRHLTWENNRTRDDVAAREPEAFAAAQAWTDQLEARTQEAAKSLFAEARSRQASPAQRAAALKASLRLEQEVLPAAQAIERRLERAASAKEALETMDRQLDRIDQVLNEVAQASELKQNALEARVARQGLRELAAPDPTALRATVEDLEAAERRRGDSQRAEALERAAAQPDARELNQRLRELAQRDRDHPTSLSGLIPPPMRAQVQALKAPAQPRLEAAETLARPRLALALEADRFRREGAPKTAVAYGLLGRDLGRLLADPDRLTSENLRPLADRAEALAGLKGDAAHQAEVNSAWERAARLARNPEPASAPEDLATRLEETAVLASEAAGHQAKRPPLTRALADLAAPAPEPTEASAIAAEAATEARAAIQAAPNQGEAYQDAARTLANAASELRLAQAGAEAAAAEAGAEAAQAQAAQAQAAAPGANAQPEEGQFNRPVGSAVGLDQAVVGEDQADWAKLREQLRQALRGRALESFSQEHQEAIRAYFQRLGTER